MYWYVVSSICTYVCKLVATYFSILQWNNTALHYAVIRSHVQVIEALIRTGVVKAVDDVS